MSISDLVDRIEPDQLHRPLEWQVAPGVPSTPPAPRHLRLVTSEPASPPEDAPSPDWVAKMARAVTEVANGDRPPGQLTRWVERGQLAMLAGRAAAIRRHPSTRVSQQKYAAARVVQQVRSIRICLVRKGVAETSAVLVGPARARAVALRFEFVGERWLVTAASLG